MQQKNTLDFDIMIGDKFLCSMKYPYCPLWPIEQEELHEFIVKQRPSLAHRDYRIEF